MVRWMLGVVLVAGIGWCGYWFVGARAVERTAHDWIKAQTLAGREAHEGGLEVSGFPNRFDLTLTAPVLADPRQGWGWRADFLQIFSLSYKPWHVIAAFSPRQWLTHDGQEVAIEVEKLQASLVMRPDTTLALQRITLAGTGLRLSSPDGGPVWQVEALSAATRAQDATADTHRLGLEATGITPGHPAALPAGAAPLDRLHLDALLHFAAALDRQATTRPPRLTRLELVTAELIWAEVTASAKGMLEPGPDGLAEGQLTLRLTNWQVALERLAALGLVTATDLPRLQQAGMLLTAHSGDPKVIQLALDFTATGIGFGGITLAPPLVLAP